MGATTNAAYERILSKCAHSGLIKNELANAGFAYKRDIERRIDT